MFFRKRAEADMAEELRHHLEEQIERNLAAGMTPGEARLAAQRQFGHLDKIAEEVRDTRRWRVLDETAADVRFAARMLCKHPGFTAAAVLTLALGIGFVTTLFTMINGIAFSQLPFEDAPRIVSVSLPTTQFEEYQTRQESCEAIALVQPTSANVRVESFVNRYSAAIVSTNFLDVLRVQPARGRGFSPEDGAAGAPRTVLIGHTLWERELERAESISGREIRVNGETHVIVGVMPKGFGFPFHEDLWIARRQGEAVTGGMMVGRLRPEVSARQASAQLTALARHLDPTGAVKNDFTWDADAKADAAAAGRPPVVEVVPFAERTVKQALRVMLSSILAATFLVLLLACANVANLVLARAVDRKKELAMRAALGASRARLIRQLLTESLLVATLGAVGGLFVTTWSTRGIWSYLMQERALTGGAPFWMHFNVDARVFTFAVLVTVLASVLTGLVPALQASRVDLNDALKEGSGGFRMSRFSRVLMNAQMAFSVCLVTIAGLFVTVMLAFNHKVLPYDAAAVMTAQVALDEDRYDDPAVRRRFFGELETRLRELPGVAGVGLTSAESLRRAFTPQIEVEGATYAPEGDRPRCWVEAVSPRWLDAFGVGLLSGRAFGEGDHATAAPVAIVNQAFVQRFGAEHDWVGRPFRYAGEGANPTPWITIVGIAPELGSVKAGEHSRGAVIYRPLAQTGNRTMTLLLRTTGDAARVAGAIRREVTALDPDLPIARLQTVQQIVEMERIGMNAFAVLFIACGLGALLLASVGIYGVVSFGVKLRTREFGVRMALGATRQMITRMVVTQGLRQLSIGLGIGGLLAVAAATLLNSALIGFGHDLWIYSSVLVLLAVVAGAALAIPARRAAKVDPMIALRAE
jgi:putative ABC transport system permease protein